MKKFSFIAMLIVLLFTGCAQTNIDVGNHLSEYYTHTIDYNRFRHKTIHYNIIGVYEDNSKTLSKIDKALDELKKEFNNKNNNKITRDKDYLSYDKAAAICRRNVRYHVYGYYRNSYEKQKLMEICINKETNRRITIYSGSRTYAKLVNKPLHFKKILKIFFEKGDYTHIRKEKFSIEVKEMDNKIYLLTVFSKPGSNNYIDVVLAIDKVFKKYDLEPKKIKIKIDPSDFFQ
jgi:hypothetical protein